MATPIEYLKIAVGERFKLFRQILFQSIHQLAEESGTMPNLMRLIETGILMPDLLFLEHFFQEYKLNLTWLLTGAGNMFFAKGPKTPADVYEFCQHDETDSPAFQQFLAYRREVHEYALTSHPQEKKETEAPWEA
jgi:transcriptional regulator with XRE-family HTH domain